MDQIEKAFNKFDRENPEIYRHLERLTFALFSRGKRQYGVKAIFEDVRFEIRKTHGSEDFKLNNNYTALYARKLLRDHPLLQNCRKIVNGEYRDFFELRVRYPRGTQHRAPTISINEEYRK